MHSNWKITYLGNFSDIIHFPSKAHDIFQWKFTVIDEANSYSPEYWFALGVGSWYIAGYALVTRFT